jgi:hypothetical protein
MYRSGKRIQNPSLLAPQAHDGLQGATLLADSTNHKGLLGIMPKCQVLPPIYVYHHISSVLSRKEPSIIPGTHIFIIWSIFQLLRRNCLSRFGAAFWWGQAVVVLDEDFPATWAHKTIWWTLTVLGKTTHLYTEASLYDMSNKTSVPKLLMS